MILVGGCMVQRTTQSTPSPNPSPSPSPKSISTSTSPPSGVQSSPSVSADTSKFKLLAELGRGGMATVFLAVARGPAGFNKLVVVKCLRPSLAAEPEFLEMFLAEARLAARINHPNVVQTNEVGFDGQFYYIAMEYIEGPSLESIVRKAGTTSFPVKFHLHVLIQALEGLHNAHELRDFEGKSLNVVHRDISPHNIMVSYDGHVKLLDFGIAKAVDSGSNTRTGILKGKCAYMAPEQFGGHNIDRRADVFAAGVCLWQAITGTKLWKGLSDAEIFSKLSRGEIPSPKTVKPDLPDELVKITMKALALNSADRWTSAAEFGRALEDFVTRNATYRTTTRELTEFVSQLFASERAKMRATVEEQLRLVNTTGSSLVAFSSDLAGGAMPMAPITARRSRRGLIAVAMVVILGLGVGGVFFMRSRAAASATQEQTVPPATQAKVTIAVTPDGASIFFDDAPLTGNPVTATFPRDGLTHRVRAEAPGYEHKIELVALDSSNVSVQLDLTQESDEVDPFGNKLTALTVKTSPGNARVYLDQILLPNNPSNTKYPRDGKEHELRAEADGYLPKSQKVTFDGPTLAITLSLDRDKRWTGRRAPAAPPPEATTVNRDAPPPTAAPQPPPAPTPTKKVNIDRSDPWAK
jgi:eukaryotic-like serine/threonine-protein kinase